MQPRCGGGGWLRVRAIYGPGCKESRIRGQGRDHGGDFIACGACLRRLAPLHDGAPDLHERFRSMRALFLVIDLVLELYIWILIAAAIFSWLVAFNVVNVRNSVVGMIGDFLYRITEPALRPIRNVMPNLGGIDISPVILILIIIFIRYCIALYILPNVF
jgi:YggT family protein